MIRRLDIVSWSDTSRTTASSTHVCRSNVVETPRPGECERLDEHWRDIAEDYERIYSLSGGYDTDGGDLQRDL